jgi:hypothetical protein
LELFLELAGLLFVALAGAHRTVLAVGVAALASGLGVVGEKRVNIAELVLHALQTAQVEEVFLVGSEQVPNRRVLIQLVHSGLLRIRVLKREVVGLLPILVILEIGEELSRS